MPELLLTPFFLTPSVGGGIDEGTGVPLATGVLEVESRAFSPFELVATASVFEAVDDESFDGDSSLTGATTSNLRKALGDNFKVIIMFPFDDFRRGPKPVDGLADEAIVGWMMKMRIVGLRVSGRKV